jgi:hypothetical protein
LESKASLIKQKALADIDPIEVNFDIENLERKSQAHEKLL